MLADSMAFILNFSYQYIAEPQASAVLLCGIN
jgi:hypothetical protein